MFFPQPTEEMADFTGFAAYQLLVYELLQINVNELLTGEHIIMDNYKDIAEKILWK